MTVEERARSIFTDDDLDRVGSWYVERVQFRIAQALRDQIEDCAKECDQIERYYREDRKQFDDTGGLSMYSADAAQRCAFALRALTAPTETEREVER